MGVSREFSSVKRKKLAKWFPVIAETAKAIISDSRSAARLETAEILLDIEQVTTLFSSLEDWRSGQIMSMDTAFGDL